MPHLYDLNPHLRTNTKRDVKSNKPPKSEKRKRARPKKTDKK